MSAEELWTVAIAASAILGFAAGGAPDFVVGVVGIALMAIVFLAPATLGTSFGAAPDVADLAPLGGFILVHLVVRVALRRLLHRSA